MSSKIEFGTISDTVKDPMLSDNFLFEVPNLPTGGNDSKILMVQCQQATLPGCTLNVAEVQLFGHTLEYAANKTFGHDLSLTIIENVRGEARRMFEKWAELIRSTQGQVGKFKNGANGYARDGYLTVLDNEGKEVLKYVVRGCWPSQIPDTTYDGSNSSLITHQVTLKYDIYERVSGYTN